MITYCHNCCLDTLEQTTKVLDTADKDGRSQVVICRVCPKCNYRSEGRDVPAARLKRHRFTPCVNCGSNARFTGIWIRTQSKQVDFCGAACRDEWMAKAGAMPPVLDQFEEGLRMLAPEDEDGNGAVVKVRQIFRDIFVADESDES